LNQKKITIPPVWDLIDTTRESVITFLHENRIDDDSSIAIGMVTNELLENAVKYGSFSNSRNSIDCKISIDSDSIVVEVINPTSNDTEQNLVKLDETIQWIRGFQNPFEAYVNRLVIVSSNNLHKGESGLGLVRIAYEGHSIVDFYTSDDNLYISAVYNL
jgi:hypothetical protein